MPVPLNGPTAHQTYLPQGGNPCGSAICRCNENQSQRAQLTSPPRKPVSQFQGGQFFGRDSNSRLSQNVQHSLLQPNGAAHTSLFPSVPSQNGSSAQKSAQSKEAEPTAHSAKTLPNTSNPINNDQRKIALDLFVQCFAYVLLLNESLKGSLVQQPKLPLSNENQAETPSKQPLPNQNLKGNFLLTPNLAEQARMKESNLTQNQKTILKENMFDNGSAAKRTPDDIRNLNLAALASLIPMWMTQTSRKISTSSTKEDDEATEDDESSPRQHSKLSKRRVTKTKSASN